MIKIFIFASCLCHLAESISCIQGTSAKGWSWKICHPLTPPSGGAEKECRCHGITIKDRGGADCTSRDKSIPFCYVIDEQSGCADKGSSDYQPDIANKNITISYSDEACQETNKLGGSVAAKYSDLGNEDVLKGKELTGITSDFFKLLKTRTWRECQETCKARFYCRAWTFVEGDPRDSENVGSCRLRGAEACCDQRRKQITNSRATSGYSCTKYEPGFIGTWSTEGPCEEIRNDLPQSGECENGRKERKYIWAQDNSCHDLLKQGPCGDGEVLVLDDGVTNSTMRTTCVKGCTGDDDACYDDEVGFPSCRPDQAHVLNDFGHTVCACEHGTYLLDQAHPIDDGRRQCVKIEEAEPCLDNLILQYNETTGTLACSEDEIGVKSLSFEAPNFLCEPGYTFAFGKCRIVRRRRPRHRK